MQKIVFAKKKLKVVFHFYKILIQAHRATGSSADIVNEIMNFLLSQMMVQIF